MSPRFNFDFKILSGRNPFLRASPSSKLLKLIGVIKGVLQTFVTAINNAYDARFISTASGGDLDKHGVTLNLPRNGGELDDDYRNRLLTEFQDIPVGLTVQSIKNAVDQVMGPGTEIDEYYKSIWEWPESDSPIYSVFGKTTIGASYKLMQTNEKVGCKFNLPSDVNVDLRLITAYIEPEGINKLTAHCAIYEDSAGAPGTKIADADHTVTFEGADWYPFIFTDVQLDPNKDFWLVINIMGGSWRYYYDSGTTNQAAMNSDTPPPDDPFGTPTYFDHSISIYASYHVFDWERPFNLTTSRYYASAIIGTEPTENELNQIEQNVIQKKPANRIIRIVKEEVGYYELYREIK